MQGAGAPLRLPAALAAALFGALVVYASLFPFEDWAWPGDRRWLDLLILPWPRPRIAFDLWSNFLGYAPLGLLLSLALRRRSGWLAAVAAAVLGSGLSYGLELAQHFLPLRHPSRLDWALNSAGAGVGALLALPLARWGAPQRVLDALAAWFDTRSAGALVLLLLWPLALLFPTPVPLALGQVGPRLLPLAAGWLEGVPWAAEWQAALAGADVAVAAPSLPGQALITALGLLAPCLLAFAVLAPGWRRLAVALGALATALTVLTLSTALNYGPQQALAWVTPATLPGLAAGLVAALLLAPLGRRLLLGIALVGVTAGVVLVAQLPADPYFALSLQRWEQGRFIRFHGLAQWLGWCWPFAAGLWLLQRLGRSGRPGRLGATPTIRR